MASIPGAAASGRLSFPLHILGILLQPRFVSIPVQTAAAQAIRPAGAERNAICGIVGKDSTMTSNKRRNLTPNIRLPEAIIRLGLGLSIPILLIWFRSLPFIVLICAVSAYLLVTGMLFFCFIRYFFQHTLTGRKKPTPQERDNPVKDL